MSLTSYAVPLAFAGLAGATAAAAPAFTFGLAVAEILYVGAAGMWLAITAFYFLAAIRGRHLLRDFQNPVTGALTAYPPVIAILLATHWSEFAPPVWSAVIVASAVWLLFVTVGLMRHWLVGEIPPNAINPGYLLPTVAGPFVVSIGLEATDYQVAATAFFGIGVFFWATVGTLVLGRIIVGSALEPRAVPSLAILMSAPAVGGLAWYVVGEEQTPAVMVGILGVLCFMGALQISLLPRYLRTPAGLHNWMFIFPIAAGANLAERLLAATQPNGWMAFSGIALGIVYAVFAAVVAAHIVARFARPRHGASGLAA